MKNPSINRRDFIKASAATAFSFYYLPATAKGANSRITVGCIGIGGKGAADTRGAAKAGGQLVALCDVADPRNPDLDRKKKGGRKEILEAYPDTKFFEDFREMLNSDLDIDAVTVSTPDHVHCHASVMAMKKGMHVYCQKPLTHSIWEARLMTETAAKYNVQTQMGNQAHANEPIRRGVELVRAGIIGQVKEVHTWTNRPIWPQGIKERPPKEKVPKGLSWDLWLGPAPWHDYNSAYVPFKWRGWWAFGTGALGDMGCHIMDMPYWALNLGAPAAVEVEQEGNTDVSGPKWSIITHHYDDPKLKFIWYDGNKQPPEDLWKDDFPTDRHVFRRFDMILVGDRGRMYFGRGRTDWVIKPDSALDGFTEPERTIPRAPGNDPYQEWMQAIKTGTPTLSNFAHSGPFTEFVLLGNLAIRLGKKVRWDAKNMKVLNTPEADRLIRRDYRSGWELA